MKIDNGTAPAPGKLDISGNRFWQHALLVKGEWDADKAVFTPHSPDTVIDPGTGTEYLWSDVVTASRKAVGLPPLEGNA